MGANKRTPEAEKAIICLLEFLIPLKRFRVRWRFLKMRDDGSCFGPTKKWITISINKRAPDLVDTILHEYAHALDIDEKGVLCTDPHQDSWGKNYARVYRILEKISAMPPKIVAYLYKERKKNVSRKRF